jgi:hypothetical protein
MMYLALSYDHRIVDGKDAVTFLVRVKEALEDPARLVLPLTHASKAGRAGASCRRPLPKRACRERSNHPHGSPPR